MPLCYKLECVKEATQIINGHCVCETHYLKEKIENTLRKKVALPKEVTVEFCVWLQDTDVFSTFVDHLNKGLQLKDLDVNAAKQEKVFKAKA